MPYFISSCAQAQKTEMGHLFSNIWSDSTPHNAGHGRRNTEGAVVPLHFRPYSNLPSSWLAPTVRPADTLHLGVVQTGMATII